MTKYIFVTGGVVSGRGKGITAASLGRLLKSRGLKVAAQKLDPYINVDPGTMSPYQHGEVYVTDDGAETDLDLGHYERFIDENLNQFSNLTTGKVFSRVINKERKGEYLGETVQIIPHVTNEIKDFIYSVGKKTNADIVITEIGGTIGDIESQPFLEAIRQVGLEIGRENSLYIHVTLVPYLHASGEHKSKPTQHSVKELQANGISPNIIVLRCDEKIEDESIKRKIANFCNVKPDCVIENMTIPVLYEAPLMLEKDHFSDVVCRELGIDAPPAKLGEWEEVVRKINSRNKTVKIALVGILVPGGFGSRGIEGMILAAKYARENNVPYLGICLGMQISVIEFARSVLGYADANSNEFDESSQHKVIDFMPDQYEDINKGGTLRLGSYPCTIIEGTQMEKCYHSTMIHERHRHRYEFNNIYRDEMINAGLVVSGTSPDKRLVETVEIPQNDFFIGVQFHPEFKSRPNKPHPLFLGFVGAALKKSENN